MKSKFWEEFVQGFKKGSVEATNLWIDLACAPFKAVYLVLKDYASRPF